MLITVKEIDVAVEASRKERWRSQSHPNNTAKVRENAFTMPPCRECAIASECQSTENCQAWFTYYHHSWFREKDRRVE
jgi:hypothetical protein